MEDILLLAERISLTISLGESHFREFKTALEGRPEHKKARLTKHICSEIGEALVAFSNADGGELLIGVEDDRQITGVPHNDDDVQMMLSSVKTHVFKEQLLPLLAATPILIDGKKVLYFSVSKGSSMVYQLPDGRCVKRRDRETIPESVHTIQFERQEIRSREYDSQFVDGARVNDLDIQLLKSAAEQYMSGLSPEKYLQQMGIAEYGVSGIRLRRAALLLFARDPANWNVRSEVRYIRVNGTEVTPAPNHNVISSEVVRGNILELIYKSWEGLRPYLAYKTEFGADSQFKQQFTYPEEACREALLNAIAHRDYSIQNGVEVYIYTDRMEIKSPGALLSTLSIDNLYMLEGSHESRNPNVARVLRENKLMRELGEGMKRIFELMSAQERARPILSSHGPWFSVQLSNRTVFTQQEVEWLMLFDQFGLTKNQKKVVLLGMGNKEFSTSDMMKALNSNDVELFTREINALRRMGLIVNTKTKAQIDSIFNSPKFRKPRKEIPRYKITQQ